MEGKICYVVPFSINQNDITISTQIAATVDATVTSLTLEVPETFRFNVDGVSSGLLPLANEVDINPMPGIRSGDWVQVSTLNCFALLKVRRIIPKADSSDPSRIYTQYSSRVIFNSKIGECLEVAPVPKPVSQDEKSWRLLFQKVLRWFLLSPMVALRVSEAVAGDDNQGVVRIDCAYFPALGINPGDGVILRSGPLHAFAVAVPRSQDMIERIQVQRKPGTGQQKVTDLFQDEEIPEHLRIWIPMPLRRDLLIDRHGLVTVERAVWPLVRSRFHVLSLPLLGVLFAALSIGLPSSPVVGALTWIITVVVILFLTLAPLRLPQRKAL